MDRFEASTYLTDELLVTITVPQLLMGNRNKTTMIGHRIMLGLDKDDDYNGYDNVRQDNSPDLTDPTGYDKLAIVPDSARVIPETSPLYGPIEILSVGYVELDTLVRMSVDAAESSTYDDGMQFPDALNQLLTGVEAAIDEGRIIEIDECNYYHVKKNDPTRRKYYDAPKMNKGKVLDNLESCIKPSIGTRNVWSRDFEAHQQIMAGSSKHKTADESMTWFVDVLIPELRKKNPAMTMYSPSQYKYGDTGMMQASGDSRDAPPYLLAALDIIIGMVSVRGGIDAIKTFLPSRACKKILICELVATARCVADLYIKAYKTAGSKLELLVPNNKVDHIADASQKLQFVWRISFWKSAILAFAANPDPGEFPTFHSDFQEVSAYARAAMLVTGGEISARSDKLEQTRFTVAAHEGGGERREVEAIYGAIPASEHNKLVARAKKENREVTQQELDTWFKGSRNATTHNGTNLICLRIYCQWAKEQVKDGNTIRLFFAHRLVHNENPRFIRSNQAVHPHRDYSHELVEFHGMIATRNQFGSVYRQMLHGGNVGASPVVKDLAWIRKNITQIKKGRYGK